MPITRKCFRPMVHRHSSFSCENAKSICSQTRRKSNEQHKEIPLLCFVFYPPFPTNHHFRTINNFRCLLASLGVYVNSKIAVLRLLSRGKILWRGIQNHRAVQQRGRQSSQHRPQLAQSRYVSSHLGLLIQHYYQPQKVITTLNLRIINLKRLAGRSLH